MIYTIGKTPYWHLSKKDKPRKKHWTVPKKYKPKNLYWLEQDSPSSYDPQMNEIFSKMVSAKKKRHRKATIIEEEVNEPLF